jgi:hypothetical protein
MERTNETLERVIGDVRQLIQWAKADREQSLEADAIAQAGDDGARVALLTQALELLCGCGR